MLAKQTIRTVATRFGLFVLPLVLLLCACSSPFGSNGGTGTTSNALVHTSSNANLLAVLPMLQKSLQAMQQLKSVHLEVRGKGTIQTTGSLLPVLANKTRYSLRGTGDLDIARHEGRLRMRLKLLLPHAAAISLNGATRLVGQKLYVQGASRQWFVLDLVSVAALLKANAGGLVPQPQDFLAFAQNVAITDHGMSTITGQQVRHITLSIDKHALGQLMNTVPQQQAKQVLASIQPLTAISADLFIDEATSRLVRLEIKGGVQVDVDGLLATIGRTNMPTPQGDQAHRMLVLTFDVIFTLSKFNQPVPKTVIPANATPIDLKQLVF